MQEVYYLEQSLSIQRKIGDRNVEGTTLNNISQIYAARGDYDAASAYLKQALIKFDKKLATATLRARY